MEPAVPSSFTEKWCNTIQNMMNRQSPFEKSNIEWWLEVPNGTDNGGMVPHGWRIYQVILIHILVYAL